MKACGHSDRQLDSRNRFTEHVLRIQDQHFALVNFGLIDIAEQKAAILTTARGVFHKNRFAGLTTL